VAGEAEVIDISNITKKFYIGFKMDLESFARSVLFGSSLDEKLVRPDLESFRSALAQEPRLRFGLSPLEVPKLPGRPDSLSLSEKRKARFPELAQIHEPRVRGEVLHFFANHELLALELMALVLLRFPDAPAPFRLGMARTMAEEQGHLRLYLERMKELGVELGELPVSSYFWDVLHQMSSPLEFVTKMSLTFEQANLDFSLFYRNAVSQTGDEKTTEVLDRVYREEIGHVKHGLEWFNRWRKVDPKAPAEESDWEAYQRLLPPPMTPRRAKGDLFAKEARKLAGFSERYISELEIYSGAKGRPPVLWIYNPFCDSEIARGKPGFSPKTVPARLAKDLEHVPMFLASDQDIVLVSERPALSWLGKMKSAGFGIPTWASKTLGELREPKLGGFEPWGWSPESFELFRPLRTRLVQTSGGNAAWCQHVYSHPDFKATRLGSCFSKSWGVEFLQSFAQAFDLSESLGVVQVDWTSAKEWIRNQLAAGKRLVAKAPWSTSGNGVRRILSATELESPLGKWIANTISEQGSIVIEPWLDKVHDLSIQLEVGPDQTRILEYRKFVTGKQFEYRGTLLGPLRDSFDSKSLQLLQDILLPWKSLIRELAQRLRQNGYQGPVGVDAMIYRSADGVLKFKPLVEINPRWTMGRVALALEEKVLPGVPAAWVFILLREVANESCSAAQLAHTLSERFPLKLHHGASGARILEGVLATQDPARAKEVLTLLFVGKAAMAEAKKLLGLGAQ
jgi:uncharacterized ferritin-like protein (DUF455 family)